MKNVFKNIGALLVLGAFVFVFQVAIKKEYRNLRDKLFPCDFTIPYQIGIYDDRFGVSKDEFLVSIEKAEKIWDNAIGKQLFLNESDQKFKTEDLKINLVYDARQDSTQKLNELDSVIDTNKSSYEKMKAEYDKLKADYLKNKNTIDLSNESEVSAFNQKVDELNNLANELNKSGMAVNNKVSEYNKIDQGLGNEFEEGIYKSSKDGEEIDIYQFKDKDNLVRVLAHELGHALSLDHSEDPNSIMYYLNSGDGLIPSPDDIKMLKNHCEIK